MFQRSLSRSLRQASSIKSQTTCTLCRCSCGREFRRNGPAPVQKRFYEPRKDLQNTSALDAQIREEDRQYERRHYDRLVKFKAASGGLQSSVDNALDFMNGFTRLQERTHGLKAGALGVQEQALLQLMNETQVPADDVLMISRMLLIDETAECKAIGKKMMYRLSSAGNFVATLMILTQSIAEAKSSPDVMKRSELAPVRRQLEARVESPQAHYYGLVLQGKVLYASGDVDGAIKCWERSLPLAVADSEPRLAKSVQPEDTPYVLALQSPWVELTNAYLAKKQWANAKWAAEIGCEQDDPTSHYLMALLENAKNEDGDHVATSTWLYHITKAAGAGHVKAAHVLGNWYGLSGWKYIEDEPPDEIKPTPFDSYPPDERSKDSLWDQISTVIGTKPPSDTSMQHQLFLTAAFPDTALGRLNMAIKWLEVSMGWMYAPSYLLAAKLLLEKTLWPAANAPESALNLRGDRYTYASKADYQAGRLLARSSENTAQEEQEIPNPGYDPDRAKDLVREVFYAVQALEYRRRIMSNVRKGSRRGKTSDFNEDMEFDEERLNKWPAAIRKWFRFPESREMYADDQRGVLYDAELKLDLKVEAIKICEEQGWDLYDEEGGLMYRHGMQPLRQGRP